MGREKGTASIECSTCGSRLNAVEQADGGTSYELCATCYPTVAAELASSHEVAPRREAGTKIKAAEATEGVGDAEKGA